MVPQAEVSTTSRGPHGKGDPADRRVRRQAGESARSCGSGRGPQCSTSRACRLTVVVPVWHPAPAGRCRRTRLFHPNPPGGTTPVVSATPLIGCCGCVGWWSKHQNVRPERGREMPWHDHGQPHPISTRVATTSRCRYSATAPARLTACSARRSVEEAPTENKNSPGSVTKRIAGS